MSFLSGGPRIRALDTGRVSSGPGVLERVSRSWQKSWRDLSTSVLHAPHTLRVLVRGDEIWLVVLAAG